VDIAIKKQDERVDRYLKLYVLRRNDDYSEEKIASTLGFGSPQALYQQLRADKHPVCPICGALPVEEGHCEAPAPAKRQARKGGGEAVPLPPAENAIGLITQVLNRLLLFEVGKLKRREERLEGGRFVVEREEWKYWWLSREDFSEEEKWRRFCEENRVDPEIQEVPILQTGSEKLTETLRRQDFPEEEWRHLCEEHGVDLEVDEVPVMITPSGGRFVVLEGEDFSEEEWSRFREQRGAPPNADRVRFAAKEDRKLEGASRVPPAPLDTLIGVYALGDGSLEDLLAVLHPDPASVDRDRLEKIVRRLQRENGRLATLVRGGNPKTGRGPAELSATEHRLAVYIQRRRVEGATDDRILREIRRETPYPPDVASLPSKITEQEVQRLGGLNLD